ncbi:MAG: response regulator [Candidatus Sulfobium sp.]|jgi:CheY-like chemotaxis protein
MKNKGKMKSKVTNTGSENYRLPRRDAGKGALLVGLSKERPGSANQRGKVLVMDDEDVIRTILSVMLLAFGYEAHLTADGEEAIQTYVKALEAGEPFDAVIMDLNIPEGMGGSEAIRRLREIDPDVKAIVSSGYRNNPAVENFGEYGFRAVLHKPYSISELREVLYRVVRRSGRDYHLSTGRREMESNLTT